MTSMTLARIAVLVVGIAVGGLLGFAIGYVGIRRGRRALLAFGGAVILSLILDRVGVSIGAGVPRPVFWFFPIASILALAFGAGTIVRTAVRLQ